MSMFEQKKEGALVGRYYKEKFNGLSTVEKAKSAAVRKRFADIAEAKELDFIQSEVWDRDL
jgi:hypothetical protein